MKDMENNDSFINDILKKQQSQSQSQSQSQANSGKGESKKHGNNKKPNRKK